MTKIDEVSEMLGGLDAKVDNVMEKVNDIDSHLKALNGTIAKHQIKMADCDQKFSSIESIKEDARKTRECITNFKQTLQPQYDNKISSIEKDVADTRKSLASVKWDYKFWGAITGLMTILIIVLRTLGI